MYPMPIKKPDKLSAFVALMIGLAVVTWATIALLLLYYLM